jgi:hypothetical protein
LFSVWITLIAISYLTSLYRQRLEGTHYFQIRAVSISEFHATRLVRVWRKHVQFIQFWTVATSCSWSADGGCQPERGDRFLNVRHKLLS